MAIQPRIKTSASVTVGASSVQLLGRQPTRSQVILRNRGVVSVFLGFSEAATVNGFELGPDEDISLVTEEEITAIAASGTSVVKILEEVRS